MPQSRASSSYGYNTLYSFGKAHDGQQLKEGLTDVNGTLYGTTYSGGKHGDGTVFSISATGLEKVLYSFRGNIKLTALTLVRARSISKGFLYGTTEYGGIPSYGGCNAGTVSKISTTGAEKVVYRFFGYDRHDSLQ